MAKDLKYGVISIPPIGEDEPVFIIRANDDTAMLTIDSYAENYKTLHGESDSDFLSLLETVYMEFGSWKANNSHLVKKPD